MSRCRSTRAAIVLFASLASASAARSDWPPSGLGVCTDAADQTAPSMAPDGTGGAFIGWLDDRQPDDGVYMQRVSSGGEVAPGWPPNGLFISQGSQPSLAADGSGGAYVAWEDGSSIVLQRVTPSGGIATGWPDGGLVLANIFPESELAVVVSDGYGGALVAWTRGASVSIRVQRVTGQAALAPGWAPGGVTASAASGAFVPPALASDGAGGALVAWENGDIFAQRVGAGGSRAPGWPENGMVVCGAPGTQRAARIAADGAGGAYVTWWDERDFAVTGTDAYLARITGGGAVATGWPAGGLPACAMPGDQRVLRVAADETGVILFWSDRRTDPDGDVYALRLTDAAAVAPGWPVGGAVISDAPAAQVPGGLVPDGTGGALLLWSDSRDLALTGADIYVQHLASDGTIVANWPAGGLALCAAAGNQTLPRCVSNGSGGAIVSWEDGREGAGNRDIYAALINGDGSTPVLLSLVSAEAVGRIVRIHWYVADAPGLRASLYRRDPGTEWVLRRSVEADGAGHLVVEDRDVAPGMRYGYRLGIEERGEVAFVGEVWVEVPPPAGLSLAAVWDPARRSLRVSISLPADAPADLDLFDPGGRRLAHRDLAGLGSGSHALALEPETALRAGVHFLRLRQGDLEAMTRAVVLR